MEKHIKSKREELLLELSAWVNIMVKPQYTKQVIANAKKMTDVQLVKEIHMLSFKALLSDSIRPMHHLGTIASN